MPLLSSGILVSQIITYRVRTPAARLTVTVSLLVSLAWPCASQSFGLGGDTEVSPDGTRTSKSYGSRRTDTITLLTDVTSPRSYTMPTPGFSLPNAALLYDIVVQVVLCLPS